MRTIAIVAGGPKSFIPDLSSYRSEVDDWIGADQGVEQIINHQLPLNLAIGDFDSASAKAVAELKVYADKTKTFPIEKDKTDLELAIDYAIKLKPQRIYFFGVTGGRMDHQLANIQLLIRLVEQNIQATIIDLQNQLTLYKPGEYRIESSHYYPFISFLPFTEKVEAIALEGFYYPLTGEDIKWGSTLCLSNQLISKSGTFSFRTGILIVVKSRDVLN